MARHVMIRGSLLAAAGLLTLAVSGCGDINSRLYIQPQNSFVLGGGQKGPFTVEAENVGPVEVTIASRASDGVATALGVIAPGKSDTVKFPQGAAAVFGNPSMSQEARVEVRVTGDTDLGMRYERRGTDASGSPTPR